MKYKIIDVKYFLKQLYLKNKSPEEISELYSELFSELEGLLCSVLVGVIPNKIEAAKIEICGLLDSLKERYLKFELESFIEV